jgi:hypothetical protein
VSWELGEFRDRPSMLRQREEWIRFSYSNEDTKDEERRRAGSSTDGQMWCQAPSSHLSRDHAATLDIFACLVTSCECERAFSSAKKPIILRQRFDCFNDSDKSWPKRHNTQIRPDLSAVCYLCCTAGTAPQHITPEGNSLGDYIIEALECLRVW